MLIPSPEIEFGPWGILDVVVGPLVLTYVTTDLEPVDLTGYTVSRAIAAPPLPDPYIEVEGAVVGNAVEITLPGVPFTYEGIWQITVTLEDGAGNAHSPEPFRFIVEDRSSGWLTLAGIRSSWRDAPRSDVSLWQMLEVARGEVEAYWAQPIPIPVPANLVVAQQMQAREIWNESKRDPATFGMGDGDFLIRPAPLTPAIQVIIRHKRVKPVVA